MKRRKEMTLRRFRDGHSEESCICRQITELKRDNLYQSYQDARQRFLKAKPDSKSRVKALNYLMKVGNKMRAVKEVLAEIEASNEVLEKMIEVEIDGHLFSRLSWNSDYRRSCKGKVKYSESSAPQAAVEMTDKLRESMEAYKCRHCDGWHVGHSVIW